MPAAELAQKQVGKMTGIADVMQDDRAADLAGVVDDQISKAKHALGNAGRHGDVLNLAEGNVPGRPSDQASVDFEF